MRSVCNKPCDKKISCGHFCIGICGEPCPTLCRICDKEDVTTILFGNEDELDARFIFLEECSHIVEVSAMDHLMEELVRGEDEIGTILIKLPECPWCKTPIRFNPRYNNTIKSIRRDVEQVKIRMRGDSRKIEVERAKLLDRIRRYLDLMTFTKTGGNVGRKWTSMFRRMETDLKTSYVLSLDHLQKSKLQLDMYDKLKDLQKQENSDLVNVSPELLQLSSTFTNYREQFDFLQEKTSHFIVVSEQEVEDWQREFKRCKFMLLLVHVISKFDASGVDLAEFSVEKDMLAKANKYLSDGEVFSEEKESSVEKLLNDLKTLNPLLLKIGITEKERDMIVKAMKFTQGHWFKCPEGHVYAIGECGGAMERSTCPHCQAPIGGMSHQLDEGNTLASEMDGARYAAYSEEAFRIEDLDLDFAFFDI